MQLSESYLIGVDGGGTKTYCVIGDKTGRIIGTVVGGGSNIKSTKPEKVRLQIVELLNDLLNRYGIKKEEISGIYIGTAGGDRNVDKKTWHDWMMDYFSPHPCRIQITNDALPALVSGTFSLNGLVVIAGTGSIAYLVQDNGARTIRSGGWGYLLGDDGSGYHIGNEALRYVTTYYDQHGELSKSERLTQMVLQHYNIQNVYELVPAVYDDENPRTAIASLAMSVLDLAEEKYQPAVDIVQQATKALVGLISTIFTKEKIAKEFPIVLCGGLFSNELFLETFKHAMRGFDNKLYVPTIQPVVGSYLNALVSEGIEHSPELRQEVIRSWTQLMDEQNDERYDINESIGKTRN